ncbi:MAG: hypothetical protein LBO78_04065 [Rickettsiales bacterium]|jgi:hypothetical protein|nr:hypothetical protein [Rickettsiales bacterium]
MKNVSQQNMDDAEAKYELYGAFKENLAGFKQKPSYEAMSAIDVARLLCAPGPAQYLAFHKFFAFLAKGSDASKEEIAEMMTDDLVEHGILPEIAQFFDRLEEQDVRGQDITLSMGSLWENEGLDQQIGLERRKALASRLERMADFGAHVRLRTTARDFSQLSQAIAKESVFGLPHSSFIHFAKVSDKVLFVEFPHTQTTYFRLSAAYDLDKIEYAPGAGKGELCAFFDGMAARKRGRPIHESAFVRNFFSEARSGVRR